MSQTTKKVQRPLSPHLQVYKLPLTALMSISHRATGASLIIGTLLVAGFLIAAATSEQHYNFVMTVASSKIGLLVMFLWSFALYFHMFNGIRHMFWDTGRFLEKGQAMRTNYIVLMCAVTATAVTWGGRTLLALIFTGMGG
tara:strand:+ start:35915 stop:36337 length:423 start_codon:yes stop_codon:yes gene_type:complete